MEIIDPAPNYQEPKPETSFQSDASFSNASSMPVQSPQDQIISVGEWFLILLVVTIPLVNLIVLIIWALGGSSNLNKVNFAKANLIWLAILIILGIFFFSSLIAIFMALQ